MSTSQKLEPQFEAVATVIGTQYTQQSGRSMAITKCRVIQRTAEAIAAQLGESDRPLFLEIALPAGPVAHVEALSAARRSGSEES